MKWSDAEVQLGPASDGDLFHFLKSAVNQWLFLANARRLNLFEVSASTFRGAVNVRDKALEQWNRWMQGLMGREWFLVSRRFSLGDDMEANGVFYPAGQNLLIQYRCEGVLAQVREFSSRSIITVAGEPCFFPRGEGVELQCVFAPPHQTLKILPVDEVAACDIFNH